LRNQYAAQRLDEGIKWSGWNEMNVDEAHLQAIVNSLAVGEVAHAYYARGMILTHYRFSIPNTLFNCKKLN